MTLTDAARTIDRLVADLARATGRDEKIVRLAYGLDGEHLDGLLAAEVTELASGHPAEPVGPSAAPVDGEFAA
jgi:hypothetical protein